MKGYLLDTSTCVAIFRGNRDVANRMEKVGKDKWFISQVVVAFFAENPHFVQTVIEIALFVRINACDLGILLKAFKGGPFHKIAGRDKRNVQFAIVRLVKAELNIASGILRVIICRVPFLVGDVLFEKSGVVFVEVGFLRDVFVQLFLEKCVAV